MQEIVGSTPQGTGMHRGRLFNSGTDGRVSYIKVNENLYQLNEVRLALSYFKCFEPCAWLFS